MGQRGKAKGKGQPQADRNRRDSKNAPLCEVVQTCFERELLHHGPDAWIDHDKSKVGHEICLNCYVYGFTPARPLEVIDAELKPATDRILEMIAG